LFAAYGAKDAITRPETARRVLHLNDNARLAVHPDAGHALSRHESIRFGRGDARLRG
jgi:hypothetical protein